MSTCKPSLVLFDLSKYSDAISVRRNFGFFLNRSLCYIAITTTCDMRVQANQFTVKALFSVHNRWIIPNKKHVMDPREKKIFLIDRAHLHERGVQVEVLDEIFFWRKHDAMV